MEEMRLSKEEQDFIQGLRHEVSSLLYHWSLFVQLYGKNENVDVLIEVNDQFFGAVQQLLWDYVLLTIGKLIDHDKTKGHENLSFKNSLVLLSKRRSADQMADLKKDLETLIEKCELIKTIRHKRLAHFGKEYMIKRLNQEPLKGVNRTTIEEALALIKKIMSDIEKSFGWVMLGYDAEDHFVGDELLWYLKESGSYKEVREKAEVKKMR